MTPPVTELPSTLDDLRAALQPPASVGVKLFEIHVLQSIFAACPDVKDPGDLMRSVPTGSSESSVLVPLNRVCCTQVVSKITFTAFLN
jgi:hypothetical protein